MSNEKELEQFKEEFIKEYIDSWLDRLLDLRNNVKKAESFDDIHKLMNKEKELAMAKFGATKKKK